MYHGPAKELDHDLVIEKSKQPMCKINSWPSFRRSNEEIIKQENIGGTNCLSAYANHHKARRKRSKGRKNQKKSMNFSTHAQRSVDVSDAMANAKHERKDLTRTKSNLQTWLKAIEQRIAKSRSILLDLHKDFVTQIASLTKYQAGLLSLKKDLLRLVRLKMENAAELHERLTRFESQRKSLMQKMTNPQWNKQHCFYMLALERFRENKQVKQIIEIAEAMSGNIAITAVAHHSIQQHKQALAKYQNLVVDRSLFEERHSTVTKRLQICSSRLSEYESLLVAMKKKISRKDKEKIRKAERIILTDNSQTSKSFTKPKNLCWSFKQRLLGNTEALEEEYDEDDESFWKNVDGKEFIKYLDEFLNELTEQFGFTKIDDTNCKLYPRFQHNHLHKSLDESYQASLCSDDSRAYSSSGSIPGWGSSNVTTPDPKKVNDFLTPTSPGSNCRSLTEVEFPPDFYSIGGFTVETVPSLSGDVQQTQDYIEGCGADLKALDEILETISAARNDYKTCCRNLNMTTRKIEELDLQINKDVPEKEISSKKGTSKTEWSVELTEQKRLSASGSVQENTDVCGEEN